jgi:hypothetical protein
MAKKIQIRRGTATDWTTFNPVLSSGELGYDITNKNFKVGDGTLTWTALPYTYVSQTELNNLLSANDAVLFKGTIGTGGTITALPTTHDAGWAYKVIEAGTYAGKVCEVGDLLLAIVDRAGTGNTDGDWAVFQTNTEIFTRSITIPTTGWSTGSAPFTREITVASILSTDVPTIDIDLSAVDFANLEAHTTAWNLIYRAVTGAGTITFYATEVPAQQIVVTAKVVR